MTVRRFYAPVVALALGIAIGVGITAASSAIAAKTKAPAMEAALTHLQKAKRKLENATSDTGGHRQKAIDLTRQAIAEVQKGILADKAD